MFPFSKKLLLVLVAVALLFGGESQLAEALKCWKCGGSDNVCDAEQAGASEDCDGACGMKQTGNAITKYCETEEATWKEADVPKCVKGIACFCISNDCNKPKDFGLVSGSGGTGGGGGTGSGGIVGDSLKNGGVGTSSVNSARMIKGVVAMMAFGASVFIAQ